MTIILFSLIAPGYPPQSPTVLAVNATTAKLTWAPPPPEYQNGRIDQYTVVVTSDDTSEQLELYTNATSLFITDLHPFYMYRFSIAAFTIARGPFNDDATLRMPEAGKCFHIAPLKHSL